MHIAIIYLTLISIDILLVTRFEVFGMLPMSYFVAGTGASFLIFIYKYGAPLFFKLKQRYLIIIFLLNILLISLFQLFTGIRYIVGDPLIVSDLLIKIELAFNTYMGISFFLLTILIIVSLNKSMSEWLLYSSIIGFVRYGIEFFMGILPNLLYRYLGILDIFMLFGWLMILTTLINEKYDADHLVY